MVTTIATNPGSPSTGNDEGWAAQGSFCITIDPPPEYASIGPALTDRRRQDAEAGPAHRTARKLGRLFEGILPFTPLLIQTYGKRAAQIMNTPGANPTPSTELHGPFAEFVGADATSVWAAATSGDAAIAVHLMACMIARAFEDPVVATNIWAHIIALHFCEVKRITPPDLPDSFDCASRWPADKIYTMEEVRQLDMNTRQWLRTADEVMADEHSQFHLACLPLVRGPIFSSSDSGKSLYINVKEDWFMALNMMENLLKDESIPEDAIGSAGFIAMSAWHLYPPLTTADTASMTVNTVRTSDELMKTTMAQSITFVDPPVQERGVERNVSWPLTRSAVTPAAVVGTINERLSMTDLHLVAFGSLLRLWGVRQNDSATGSVALWTTALWDCINKVMQRQARPEWLRLLVSAATRLLSTSGTERDLCIRLINLGYRQGHLFLGVPSGKAALPWFGLRSPHILAALSQESPVECAIEYLRQLCLHGELGPDESLITWISPSSKGISTHLYTSAIPRMHIDYRVATAAGSQVPNKLPDLQPDLKIQHDKGKGRYTDEEKMEEVVSFKHSRWHGQSSIDGTRLLELEAKKHRDNSYESSMRWKINNFTTNVNRGYSDLEASERSSRYDNDYFAYHGRTSSDTPRFAASVKSKEEGSYPLTSLIAISGLFTGEYKLERGSGILTSASGSIPKGFDSTLIASAVKIADGSVTPSVNRVEPRQDSSGSSPESSKFLRRSGGVVAVLGDRIYYDGGSVSESGPADRPPHRLTNTTLYIDLSKSWSLASVSISEREEPDLPAMASPAILTDRSSECFYVWGHAIPAPISPELWRFCDKGGGDRATWAEVDLPSDSEFGKYPGMSHAAYASTNNTGFAFGGRRDWKDFSDKYMTFDFKTKAWASHVLPGPLTATEDHTLWGARAVFVPSYGPNGLVFPLGGVRGGVNDGDAYPTFRTVSFMDPVTNRWYTQDATATSDGFPEGRTGSCLVGIAGANNTYEIYMFGGANNYERKAYDDIYVLSLPSFTWSLAGKVGKGEERYGQACALVGNSQLLTWGGLRFGEWKDTYLIPDTFRQGLGIFDLNTLEWASGYDVGAAPYRAHSKVVDARSTRPTPAMWSPDVRDFFETSATELPDEDENENKNENDPKPSSSTPVGAIVGGVAGGVALVAVAAAVWSFFSRRRRARTRAPPDVQEQDSAADKTQYEPVPESVSPQYVAELHEHNQPAEMTGQGKELPRQVHEMDGGYTNRS